MSQSISHGEIEVSVDPFYCESNMKVLAESIKQFQQGKIVTKTFEELESLENE